MLTEDYFFKNIAKLCTIYNRETSRELDKIYWNCLKNKMTNEELDACLTLHLQNPISGAFFPKPSDLIKHLKDNNKLKALEIWGLVTGDRHEKELAKLDLVAEKAMRMIGGWGNFASVKIDELPFRARDFVEAYCLILEKSEREEVFDDTKALANIIKRVNSGKRTETGLI